MLVLAVYILAFVGLWRLWPPASSGWWFWTLAGLTAFFWWVNATVQNAHKMARADLTAKHGDGSLSAAELVLIEQEVRHDDVLRLWVKVDFGVLLALVFFSIASLFR